MSERSISCTIMRGGTSKALFLWEKDLPAEPTLRDEILLRLMGSPDIKQIDGLGGAASVTSKIAILAPSSIPDADIDYLFAQVSLDKAIVSMAGNCGNISAAVGPFAIESGLVKAKSPVTLVRVHNRNTGKIIEEVVQTPEGRVCYEGDYSIRGVPGTAAPIELRFLNPEGSVLNKLLPTGNACDVVEVDGLGTVKISIVDASNPVVFVEAKAMGLTGMELPTQLDENIALLQKCEQVRGAAAVKVGLCKHPSEAADVTPAVPKLALIAPPKDYITTEGKQVNADKYDIAIRMLSMQRAHPTCAMTGAMCTAAAAAVPGSLVQRLSGQTSLQFTLRLGHGAGVLEAGAQAQRTLGGETTIYSTTGFRTARKLMVGRAFY